MRLLKLVCLLTSLAAMVTPLQAQPFAERLPADTVLLISAPDLKQSWGQFQKSTLWDIWNEPSVQAFYKKLTGLAQKEANRDSNLKKLREQFKATVGIDLEDLPNILFQGDCTIALLDFEVTDEGPPKFDILVTAKVSPEKDTFSKLLKFVVDMAVEDGGFKKKDSTVAETAVTELSHPDLPFTLHLSHKGDRFYMTTEPATIKACLSEGSVEGEQLAKNPLYIASRKGIDAKQEIGHFYINMEELWKKVDSQLPPDAKDIMEKLGVFGVRAISAGSEFDGKSIKDHFYLSLPEKRKGIQKLFTYAPTQLKGLKYAPADVGSFSGSGFELNELYKEGMKVFKSIDDKAFTDFEAQKKEFEEKLGMKVDDLVACLGSQVTTFARKPTGDASKKSKPNDIFASIFRATYIISLTDEKKAATGIAKLIKMLEQEIRAEEHHGWKINFVDMPGGAEDSPYKNVAWAVKDGHLFVSLPGSDLVLLAKEQAAGSTGLGSSERFKAEMSRYAEGFAGFSYVNLAAYLRALWATATPYLKEMLVKGEGPIEFKDLPDIEAIAKHITPLTGAAYSDNSGLRMVYRSPMGGASTMVFLGLGAAVALPAMGQAQNRAKQVACLSTLKLIGLAAQSYKTDTGKYPEELGELVTGEKKYLKGEPFTCPSDPFPQKEGKIQTSFIYIYSNKLGTANAGKTILCYDKSPKHNGNTRNILFLDGSVQNMSDFEFRELFNAQKERLKKLGVQVFIGWGKLK